MTFTPEEIQELVLLNSKLIKIEEHIISRLEKQYSNIKKDLNDCEDLVDYELDVIVSYYLKETDIDWFEDNDNILVEYNNSAKSILFNEHGYRIGDNEDHKELGIMSNYPEEIQEMRHCYLFHDLYDHHFGINMRDCLRIGSIWIDIVNTTQSRFNLETKD
jgi:hypothetical protein